MTGIAVIGAGRIGRIHAGNILRSRHAEIRYVVDIDESAAKDLAASCGAKVGTVQKAFADPEVGAVVIASSTDTHSDLITMAAQSGKAIFCEKPLDLDVQTARNSLKAVADHGVLLCLGFNRRHDPSFNRLKNEVLAGTVGNVEVISITSRDPAPPPADYIARSGGLFRDMMIHDFDLARWLMGEEPIQVFATGSVQVDDEIGKAGDIDTAIAVLRSATGKLCQITNSRRCSYGYDQRIEVFGSKGMVRADNATETRVATASADGFRTEPALPFFLERYADAYRLQLDRFLRAVSGDSVEIPGGEDGLIALQMADAAQRSLETGKPMPL